MNGTKDFIFTMTTGRTGTAFMSELIASNTVRSESHHEILGWDKFGVDTPDVSHMTLFNSQGNTAEVQRFWTQKLQRIAIGDAKVYSETSHLLMKCGLIENVWRLRTTGRVHLVEITRNIYDTIASFVKRNDFSNYGNMWMWYLDPEYPRNILRLRSGLAGVAVCAWYILEIRARSAYYRHLFQNVEGVYFHRVTLEEMVTVGGASKMLQSLGLKPPARMVMPQQQNASSKDTTLSSSVEQSIRRLIESIGGIDPEHFGSEAAKRGPRF